MHRCSRAIAARLLLAAMLSAGGAARAQPVPSTEGPGRPAAAHRTVHLFDFEEHRPDARGETNPERIPRYWDPVHVVPGFPDWNEIAFDRSGPGAAHTGEASVRLPTRGGSTRLRLQPGAIPVLPRGDYLVTAFVRTDRLRHARAFVVARMLDQDRKPMPPTEVRSQAILSQNDWTPVSLALHGAPDGAAFLQIDLELLQQEQQPGAPATTGHDLVFEDVDGAAWFDDVGVYLVPRCEISTGAPANVFLAPERPALRYFVRDMVGDALTASIVVEDADGVGVGRWSGPADASGRAAEWLPDLRAFGWYLARLDIIHQGVCVARTQTEFLWLPPLAPAPTIRQRADQGRIGLALDAAADAGEPWPAFLPRLVQRLSTGFLVLPAADSTCDQPGTGRTLRHPVLDALLQQRQDLTLAYTGPLDGLGASPSMEGDDPAWIRPILPLLDAYGQRISRWQLGTTGSDRLFWDRLLPAAPAAFRAGVGRYVPGATSIIPWRSELARPALDAPGQAVQGVALSIPAAVPSSVVPIVLREWLGSGAGEDLTVTPELPDAEVYGRRAVADELLRRATELWAAVPEGSAQLPRLAVERPWRASSGQRDDVLPGPQLAALRTIADHLAGRRFITWLPVAPGVKCAVLADAPPPAESAASRGPVEAPSGVIVAWNESAAPELAVLHGYLGDRPMSVVDVFGNATPVVQDTGPGRACTVAIPQSPILIEGVEPQIARLIASFRVEPPFARAVITEHAHTLIIENPWPMRLTGRLQVVEPTDGEHGWRVAPAGVISLSIAPGAVARVPFTFSFGPGEEAGIKTVTVRVQLNADHPLPALDLRAPVEIGLPDLEFQPDLIVSRLRAGATSGPADAVVVVTVTNKGTRTRTLRLDVFAPGYPSQEQPISDLAPGETARKRFVFKGAAAALSGKRIMCSAGDIDAPERLNKSVRAP